MRRLLLLIAALFAVAGFAGPSAGRAEAFCDESEGCSPCGGPTIVIDGKNTRIEWVVC